MKEIICNLCDKVIDNECCYNHNPVKYKGQYCERCDSYLLVADLIMESCGGDNLSRELQRVYQELVKHRDLLCNAE